ncbi:MAG: (E)-4-hydroxy-3-methylbut-2-enyl-diphosphate synthase [Bacteroidales bacterium]|nr:(E)-4-hydroxy-3-methylbut-2-enyl-diphosphate synthase [Bacteroidales bacterium]
MTSYIPSPSKKAKMQHPQYLRAKVGDHLEIGPGAPLVIQTMCNTHTSDVEATVAQCLELAGAGAQMVRITVPGLADIPALRDIRDRLRAAGCDVPLVADIHFSSATALEAAKIVGKVRINPGNFHPDHETARREFARFLEVCREHGTAVRVGLNHGSLGKYITDLYGNTPEAMALAAMEWLEICIEAQFFNVVVSLKASNTVVMVQAYRELMRRMQERGYVFPLHLGVTEAGNGEPGRIKSCIGIGTLLREGIGNTLRVSLTEPPAAELPVAAYLAARYGDSPMPELSPAERRILDAACEWGPALLCREIDEIPASAGLDEHLSDEIMQGARRRFYRPEYIACPGCGRTMYDLQGSFEQVKARTAHLKGMVIAVMGCIVNGPGEMADADWGYVGEGGGKVSIYRKGQPVLRHIPDSEAIDRLLELIEKD